MRSEATYEDYIPSIVLSRLRQELGLTYAEICLGVGMPPSTLNGNIGTSSETSIITYPGRIVKLADYFRNEHGLEYVTGDYLLRGGPEDVEKINALKRQFEIEEQIKDSNVPREKPPFFDITGQE